jgi:hypothetical protein
MCQRKGYAGALLGIREAMGISLQETLASSPHLWHQDEEHGGVDHHCQQEQHERDDAHGRGDYTQGVCNVERLGGPALHRTWIPGSPPTYSSGRAR